NKPIGFTRKFDGALDPKTGYARKDAIAINDFSKETYGGLLSTLSKNGNTDNTRAINEVILVCNPLDYFTKIMPASTVLTPQGAYVNNIFPFPTKVIQSVGVPKDHAVIGLADRYFMGMGTAKNGKLEYSDEYKFLEDLRTYKIKLFGMGKPLDINAFLYLDISNVQDVLPKFEVKTAAEKTTSKG
ncbi:MAG: phage major capsid protein, partial [Ruminiclostridium sp.]|nr:phage major capsid protein [Ruminiclostridium sp.]